MMNDFDDCGKCDRWLGKNASSAYKAISASSGILSVVGSMLILFMIKRRHASFLFRNRLLFMLSIIDVLSSISLGLSIIPSPPEDPWGRPTFGIGNERTCTTQGFAIQIGTAAQGYNAMLCLYYLNVIKYEKSDSDIAEKYEWRMHAYALAIPLCTAIGGAAGDLFSSNGRNCWLSASSANSGYAMFLLWLTAAWTVANGITIIVSMAMIYRTVRSTENNLDQYRFTLGATQETERDFSLRCCTPSGSYRNRTVMETYHQALLYVLCYLVTYLWTGINIIASTISLASNQQYQTSLILDLLQALFLPMQGFFNFLAYIWPKYTNLKKNNHGLTFCIIMKRAVFETNQTRNSVARNPPQSIPTRSAADCIQNVMIDNISSDLSW